MLKQYAIKAKRRIAKMLIGLYRTFNKQLSMFGKKILFFSVILLITMGVASAGDNATSHAFADLQEIIDNADEGSIIELDSDYSYSEGDRAIKIHKALTVNGNNHVLDGKGQTQIM